MTVATLPYRVLTPESNTDEWLGLRQLGVGASESPAVLGDSAWGTPFSVYQQKIGEVVDATTDLMEFGHLAEPLIVGFIERHPERYGWIGDIVPSEGLLQSREWPHLLGTLDRRVCTPDGDLVPLELKSVNDFVISEWKVGDDEQDDDEPPTGGRARYEVPRKYKVQVMQQLAVTGAPFGYVAVWLGKSAIEILRVDRDNAYIDEYLVGIVGDFWNYNVLARNAPAPTLNDDLWKVFPGDRSLEPFVADDDLLDTIGMWRIATTDARDLKKEIKQLGFIIATRIGDHTEVVDPTSGDVIHTLRPQNGRRGTDFDRLEAGWPEAYAETVRPGNPYRVHRATKVKL